MGIKIDHDRPECIGCGACAALSPEHWEMDDDGKANIVSGTKLDDGKEVKEIEEEDFRVNFEAAECCPVNCIHMFRDGVKLI